jgi:CRISPR-associated endonuclease/helicase Cas3
MLDRLKTLAQFVLMTATVPDSVLQWIQRKLYAESKSLSLEEVLALPSHANKRRTFVWTSHPLTAEEIVARHKERTISIVNSVGRAQSLFREVLEKSKDISPAPEILLLHSRFYPEDRRQTELQLDQFFGPEASRSNAILISTQVVEAGIDISADTLLTELAPLNSLIQRAGRVARYPHRNVGHFGVFELPADGGGRARLGPYTGQGKLVDATRCVLAGKGEPLLLDYLQELAWLNNVHGKSDLDAISHLDSLYDHRVQVLRAMDDLNDAACSLLIRDVSSVNVIVTDDPESLSFDRRRWPRLLNVSRMSLFSLRESVRAAGSTGWTLKIPDDIQPAPSGGLRITWKICADPAAAGWLVAIHPDYANYSPKLGLELGQPSDERPVVIYTQIPPLPRYSYEREAFVIHSRRIIGQAQGIVASCPAMLRGLREAYPETPVSLLAELVCALHDAGKLQIGWQDEAQRWQQLADSRDGIARSASEPLAHTTYDPERDRRDPSLPKFPPHATCGAFAILPYLDQHFPSGVDRVLCTAISRHHGAHTRHLKEFKLLETTATVLEESLPESAPRPLSIRSESNRTDTVRFAEDCLLHFSEDERWWPLYVGLVRILRLADQASLRKDS